MQRANSSQNSTTRPAYKAAPDTTRTVSQTRTDANQFKSPTAKDFSAYAILLFLTLGSYRPLQFLDILRVCD